MTPESQPPPPPGPLPIRRLQEALINKIAAGEIIHRPASALKELVENCLDARSSSIKITVKDGGLKLLQIQDNGCGIRKADLPILAERFTTSKISSFADLSRIATYGFRGEALASISHVAQLTVVTKTKTESCAWKAHYCDGALVPQKPGQSSDPKPCAGNDGTLITIENLFYNTPTRLSALRSSSEEYAKILDVVTRYAVHNPQVSFVCKKTGSAVPDVSTPSGSNVAQTIKLLYGNSIARELLNAKASSSGRQKRVSIKGKEKERPDQDEDSTEDTGIQAEDPESWNAEAHFTSANYQGKKMIFLLFINHRLVDSPRIKRALEGIYSGILPKGSSPFVYLSLQINPRSLDVNVHPTKKTVHFLNEELITDAIADAIQGALSGAGGGGDKGCGEGAGRSRVFEVQTLLTGGASSQKKGISKTRKSVVIDIDGESDDGNDHRDEEGEMEVDQLDPSQSAQAHAKKKKTLSQHKVRTSLKERTLDSMFPVANPARMPQDSTQQERGQVPPGTQRTRANGDPVPATPGADAQRNGALKDVKESECYLTSVQNLRREVEKGRHKQLSEILSKHTFVGIVDLNRCVSLIQHSTKLYLINHAALAEELFYQLGLRQFGNFSRIKLEPAPELRTLIRIAVDAEDESRTEVTGLGREAIVDTIFDIIKKRRELLAEYFGLNISEEGLVESLPMLLREYTPNLDKLPRFLMRLGPQVTWKNEKKCFETFLRELAYFYVPGPGPGGPDEDSDQPTQLQPNKEGNPASNEKGKQDREKEREQEETSERWQIKHVLFPCAGKYLVPSERMMKESDVVEVADLPELYKVFERC